MNDDKFGSEIHAELVKLFFKPEDNPFTSMSRSILENPKGKFESIDLHFTPKDQSGFYEVGGLIGLA